MKILELFAGSRSFSKVGEKLGLKAYTTDFKDFDNIDQVCDIFDFNIVLHFNFFFFNLFFSLIFLFFF